MNNYDLASWYVYTLTGAVDTVMTWRCIHDKRKDLPAHNYRGALRDVWATLEWYNSQGYGIFVNVNALSNDDPKARLTLDHVEYIRAHLTDLDSVTARADLDRAAAGGASFVVQTSPEKFHVYWRVQPYTGNDFYTVQQRKLAQMYNGDKMVIDATRIIRAPGFMHLKGDPFLVTAWPLPAFDRFYTAEEIATALQNVNVVEHFATRSPLGEPSMSAPSLDWLRFALTLVNPNDLDRPEWLSLTAAIKQAGWNHTDPDTLFKIWSEWCDQYEGNDTGENKKLWESIRDTETGWTTIERRTTVKAYMAFGFKDAPAQAQQQAPAPLGGATSAPARPPVDTSSEILSAHECAEWFKDCYFVERMGEIVTKNGRFMNSTKFNGRYGGKQFIITSTGKLTDEPWKAALRSTCWQIPKVDHVRFLPDQPTFEIITDALGRRGLNTYIPAKIDAVAGDVSIWLDWLDRILPNKDDQRILIEFMAHCAQYPGAKIPWSPMLQSTEGIGKTVFKEIMTHTLGDMYVYFPKAPELVKSGSTFNAWMRGKLIIIVDEIKIDERRELIEILKPMITDARVEIQSKGVDQDLEDNPANWFFFSNYKDAIPINQNGRRYAIFYSSLQSKADVLAAGMDKTYFDNFWSWLRERGGLQAIAHYLLTYPIQRGGLPVVAPETSSYAEAIAVSRSPLEVVISDSIADGIEGFRGGYVSVLAVIKRAKASGIRQPAAQTVETCLKTMGFTSLGRAPRPFFQEDPANRSEIYGTLSSLSVDGFGVAQGYE